ncbi:MAG: homocysteine S-methyltransferase family protein [Gammaproteobacteria bacterium]|nr:homocysteine S-methyltransferase family protein [Gammaproteobacteria bacterium]
MGIYSEHLPQLNKQLCITDAGLETELVFIKGIELPEFASYHLLKSDAGTDQLLEYWCQFQDLASTRGLGLVIETATWRANADWGAKIGDSPEQLDALNRKSVRVLERMRERHPDTSLIISGCVGPRGDGYSPASQMTSDEAREYHSMQIATLADTNVDLISGLTLNYIEEAVGLTRAAQEHGLPVVISFTVETDGRLPTGDSLEEAIKTVDAATGQGPVYYMINCAHPTHFDALFDGKEGWSRRLMGIRANASCMSHAELDESEELDDGSPEELGLQYRQLLDRLPHLTVLGGCCGTDFRHIEQICESIADAPRLSS